VICTTPRSGSTLLCRLLAATGVAGAPESYFHGPDLADWLADNDLPVDGFPDRKAALAALVHAVRVSGHAGNGLFGLRLQRHSFDAFAAALAELFPGLPGDPDRISAAFGPTVFIHLRRKDTVAQAVSYIKASQTGLWHRAPDGTEIERLGPPTEPVFDRDAIAARVAEFEQFNAAWDTWFSAWRLEPLRLTYEALAEDPQAVLAKVLTFLGRDPQRACNAGPPTARLADAVNADWIARFKRCGS
jgi:LPS sulfotransferase NodH